MAKVFATAKDENQFFGFFGRRQAACPVDVSMSG
jgi:hypothetical protein